MTPRFRELRERLRSGFWFIPGAAVLVAIGLALSVVAVDHRLSPRIRFTFGAGPAGARELLGAITTAMITFTGLVFSITVVVLQLTSSQFSPRVLRTFLRDRHTQWALAVFTATFVYSVLVLRTVRSSDEVGKEFVPGLATTVAVGLLLASVALFVIYIHHISTAIQVSAIIDAIGRESRQALERRYPSGRGDSTPGPAPLATAAVSTMIPAPRPGVLVSVDEERLIVLAAEADVVLRSSLRLGDFVPEGAPLVEVLGDASRLDVKAVRDVMVQDRERRLEGDVAFGFRQLVDIAERALSPGVNDPTTAVQALDEMHDLLRRLATRPLRTGVLVDARGQVRVVLPAERLEDYLHLALDEVLQYGRDVQQVRRRVDVLLAELESAASAQHRPALSRMRECANAYGA